MSYEVLAQKWRPQNFNDVVGQEHVTTTLKNQILSERIGHAYLFWGPRGTGKTTVARILAKAVNCPNRLVETEFDKLPTAEPCNQCDICTDISQGRSFDVFEMDAASNRGIDTIRDLRENVKLSPATCTYKIYIIDEVHMLSTEAFNALLKTLEEPPPHVIFIMATTEHAKIPKTITSRCQDFDFRHLDDEKVISRLQLITTTENITADEEVLTLIARQSEGCLRDAENLLERLVSSVGKNLTVATVEPTLGFGSSFLLHQLTEAITQRNLADSLATLNRLAKQGTDLKQCLHQLIVYFRDLRLLAIDSNLAELVQSPKSDLPELKQAAEQMSVGRLSRIIRILMHTTREIKQYGYAQLQLEAALIQLNSLEEGLQLQEIVNKLSALEQKIDSAEGATHLSKTAQSQPPQSLGAPPPSPHARVSRVSSRQAGPTHADFHAETEPQGRAPEPNPKELSDALAQQGTRDLAELPSFWEEVKSQLPMKTRYGLLNEAVPSVNGENRVKIACSPTHFSIANEGEKQNIVDALTQVVGQPVQVEWANLDTVPQTAASTDASEKKELKTPYVRRLEAEKDAQLKTVLQLFDAKILETQ